MLGLLAMVSPGLGMVGFPQGVSFEYDVYCCFVFAMVSVSCLPMGEGRGGVQPQLYADNLKCVSRDPGLLLHAAQVHHWVMSGWFVRSLHLVKCVLFSTSTDVRKEYEGLGTFS